jgi:small GTP-binding protein
LHRFVKSEWRILSSQTIGVEFASKIVKIGTGARRKRMKLQLWDTAGTERFRSVSRSYYRGAAGAILVYDIGSRASFEQLPTFLMDARALASPNLTTILAGNKADLVPGQAIRTGAILEPQAEIASSASSRQSILPPETGADSSVRSRAGSLISGTRWTATTSVEGRDVPVEVASRWASTTSVPVVVEVSAFSGEGVDELFNRLASMILTKIELGEIDPDDPQSGIQYGDAGGWDGSSIRSGTTIDDGGVRRRGKRKGTVGEWGGVFRLTKSRRRGGCCW